MASQRSFDLVVIGSGPAGYTCAIRAAQLGLNVACVEFYETLGGTCLNVGCIPSKALLQSSEYYESVMHKFKDHGIMVGKLALDLEKMMQRKTGIVQGLTKGIEGLFKKNKITWLRGRGSFVNATTVEVVGPKGEKESVTAKNVVIATGSKPVQLPIAKFDDDRIVSSTGALSFPEVPEHLVVIGGGVIGLELGSVWLRLGAKVTVIEAADRILPPMDSSLSQGMHKSLSKQGMDIQVSTRLVKAEVVGKRVKIVCQNPEGKEVTIDADRCLVSVGRRAFTQDLKLEKIGLETRKDGKIEVDGHFRTKVANVYAIGDVIDGPMLAHKADEEAVAAAEIIAGKPGHVNYQTIPNVVYTWPEVASVGYTEAECKEKGLTVKTGQFPFLANARARSHGDTDGFVKFIADARTDKVLGVHMMGPHVSELISEVVVAMEFGASSEDIARTCHAHPTLSEVVKEAALAVDKRTINI